MKQYSAPSPQAGFTIIEMLIAVLVISIGLLGMAGLQTTGIQQSHNSYLKTQASMLAYDMADRMRSNLQGVNAGNYDAVDSCHQVMAWFRRTGGYIPSLCFGMKPAPERPVPTVVQTTQWI